MKGGLPIHIYLYCHDLSQQSHLCRMLQVWMELSCVEARLVCVGQPIDSLSGPAILFWDLDGPIPPPTLPSGSDCALFLLSGDPQRAIDSYCYHPTGFLTKPVSMDALWNAMLRCADLWFSSLMRLVVLRERVRIAIPFQNLIWAEGTRRGCLLHTSHQSIAAREPLYKLEQRLPRTVFTRCQRSFLVNLNHVREFHGTCLLLSDGTQVSLGRGNRTDVQQAYLHFRRLRSGE